MDQPQAAKLSQDEEHALIPSQELSDEDLLSEELLSFRINKRHSLPIYRQIAEKIASVLGRHSIVTGTLLPPERVICEHLGISKMTLRQAYGVLASKGCIEAQRGVGTFVLGPRIEKQISGMLSFSEEVKARGCTPSSRLISLTTIPVSHDARRFLCLREGEEVYEMTRLRFSDELPLAIEVVQLPQKLFRGIERFQWETESLYNVMDRHYGVKLSRCCSEILAAPADKDQAKLLNLRVGSPLLVINRKSHSTEGMPVELSTTYYPGSRYIASFIATR
jgi:GntR family transcriptional regulator